MKEDTYATEGERQFKEFLDFHSLKFEKDFHSGSRLPDYLVHTSVGDVLCELQDVGETPADKASEKRHVQFMLDSKVEFEPTYREKLEGRFRALSGI